MISSLVKYLKFKIAKFQFDRDEEIRFYLTSRGFFSEINNLIFAIYFCEVNNKKIVIDTSSFVYEWNKNEQCILNCNYKLVKDAHSDLKEKAIKNLEKSYIWMSIRSKKFKALLNDVSVIEKLREIQDKLYVLNPSYFNFENEMISKEYVGLHIRRNDKVYGKYKEANKVDLSEYLSMIPKCFRDLPLFIVTDDDSVLKELKSSYPSKKVYSYFDKEDIRIDEKNFAKADKTYIRKHIINFLRDVDLLINSKCFIGSYSSNVGRFIALKRNFVNTYSVDCEWNEMH